MIEYQDVRHHTREGVHRGVRYAITVELAGDALAARTRVKIDGEDEVVVDHHPRVSRLDVAFDQAEQRVFAIINAR